MLAKRIIPCLDFCNGRVVKGINFENITDAGDPVQCAVEYVKQGADELVFLDITATIEGRKNTVSVVKKIAENITIPFTVGGGISSCEDIKKVLKAGANKISLNSAAVKDINLISRAAEEFGSNCIVLAADVIRTQKGRYNILINGGKLDTGIDALEWVLKAVKAGAGEVLLTSLSQDGMKNGYDLEITKLISESVDVAVIASGGCGKLQDFYDVFTKTKANGALAASLFHYRELTIGQVKSYLKEKGILVR